MEIFEPRIRSAHSKLHRLKNNPAPTIPIYDLSQIPLPNKILALNNSSVDDNTAILYYPFDSTHNDVWVRCTNRMDLYTAIFNVGWLVLGFTEWVNDKAYFGDWWATGGFLFFSGNAGNRAVPTSWNVSGSATNIFDSGINGMGTVYDMHCQYMFDFATGFGYNHSKWRVDMYVDGVHITGRDVEVNGDSHQRTFHSMNALVILPTYGFTSLVTGTNGGNPVLYLDDISVGTTQGGTDIMPLQDFNDGTLGDLIAYGGDAFYPPPSPYTPTDSFVVVNDPA